MFKNYKGAIEKMNNNFSYNKGFTDGAAQRTSEMPTQRKSITNISLYIKEESKDQERQMRREAKLRARAGWAFLAGLCWGLTPYFFHIAHIARGSNVPGSEIVIPLIPFFCALLHNVENKRTKK